MKNEDYRLPFIDANDRLFPLDQCDWDFWDQVETFMNAHEERDLECGVQSVRGAFYHSIHCHCDLIECENRYGHIVNIPECTLYTEEIRVFQRGPGSCDGDSEDEGYQLEALTSYDEHPEGYRAIWEPRD